MKTNIWHKDIVKKKKKKILTHSEGLKNFQISFIQLYDSLAPRFLTFLVIVQERCDADFAGYPNNNNKKYSIP